MSVKIVSETKRVPKNLAPPENATPHLWAQPEKKVMLNLDLAGGKILAGYINKHAEAKMRNHALSMRGKDIEVMGLMLGEVRTWKGRSYVMVRDVITSDLDATSVSVKFDSSGFERLFEKLDDAGFDYVIVGWYHSHPGYGCFMSETDLATHMGSFVSPYQLAMVIDPKSFEMAAFGVKAGKAVAEDFAVYWDEYDDPYGGVKRVAR
ncbi:MAG: hypothetical protein R6W91_08095 [Thermoplasmata archaeon]